MTKFLEAQNDLKSNPRTWLVTGAAGFIGSSICVKLLELGQKVKAIDNFSTGKKENIIDIKNCVSKDNFENFEFLEGDIRDYSFCNKIMEEVELVIHQAARGSVPRSIEDPMGSHDHNVNGFLNIINAAKENNIKKIVYASSSSVYGDHEELPKKEQNIGRPLSPYAATKLFNEVYADVFSKCYGLSFSGLRYFNVFGRRQDPFGAYAAVIPLWIKSMVNKEDLFINGDGLTSRDFCYIDNVVQANIMAALYDKKPSGVYNIAFGERTSLNELFELLKTELGEKCGIDYDKEPVYQDFRKGDVRHSLANIENAKESFHYSPTHSLKEGMSETIKWYVDNLK